MVNRDVGWKYLGFALVVSALLFTGIFVAGYQFNEHKVSALEQRVEDLENEQRALSNDFQLDKELESQQCEAINELRKSTVSEIRDLREAVESYEDGERISNGRYETVKGDYMNAVIQNMLDLRQVREKCEGQEFFEIIYFYSNEECDACEDQGTVLNFFRRENSEDVRVHPLDTDLGVENIETLEQNYNVTRYPSIVVEGELYEGFQSLEEVEKLYEEKYINEGSD